VPVPKALAQRGELAERLQELAQEGLTAYANGDEEEASSVDAKVEEAIVQYSTP